MSRPARRVHQRRLARARRAHDGGELPGGEVDGDAVEGPHLGLALAVHLGGVDGAGGDRVERLDGEIGRVIRATGSWWFLPEDLQPTFGAYRHHALRGPAGRRPLGCSSLRLWGALPGAAGRPRTSSRCTRLHPGMDAVAPCPRRTVTGVQAPMAQRRGSGHGARPCPSVGPRCGAGHLLLDLRARRRVQCARRRSRVYEPLDWRAYLLVLAVTLPY